MVTIDHFVLLARIMHCDDDASWMFTPQIFRIAVVRVCNCSCHHARGGILTILIFGIEQGGFLNEDSLSKELFDFPILIWNYALTILILFDLSCKTLQLGFYTYMEHGSTSGFLSRHSVRDVANALLHLTYHNYLHE
jgi:hypothetical protein